MEEERKARTIEEQAWQRVAMPLVIVREMREVVVTSILMDGDDDGTLFDQLQQIGSLEGRLLREAFRHQRERALYLLNLDHRKSWSEVVEHIRTDGNYRLLSEILDLLPPVNRLVREKFARNIED